MFEWVEQIWRQKDKRITEMLAEFNDTVVDDKAVDDVAVDKTHQA